MRRLVMLLLPAAVLGCAPARTVRRQIQARASLDLACEAKDVRVTAVRGERSTYVADGCGRTSAYEWRGQSAVLLNTPMPVAPPAGQGAEPPPPPPPL